MDKAIERALKDLDGLADGAIRRRILEERDEGEVEAGAHPVAETAEKAVAEAVGEPTNGGVEIDSGLLQKLRDALSK